MNNIGFIAATLRQLRLFIGRDEAGSFATAAQGGKADTALQPADIGTTAGKLVALDGAAKLPAVDGSQLTNLPIPTPDYQVFTSSGTWTKPATGGNFAKVEVWAGGGGASTNVVGGGGAYNSAIIPLADLPSTVSVSVGAGGVGNAFGGDSNFGSYVTAYGGSPGGGGGGVNSRGHISNGSGGNPRPGVSSTTADGAANSVLGGGGAQTALSGSKLAGDSVYGGGGGSSAVGGVGGNSIYGGGGGGTTGGTSIYGGNGGGLNADGNAPGGGAGYGASASRTGGRGEVRVTVYY